MHLSFVLPPVIIRHILPTKIIRNVFWRCSRGGPVIRTPLYMNNVVWDAIILN